MNQEHSIAGEFEDVLLGDRRLDLRLKKIATCMEVAPKSAKDWGASTRKNATDFWRITPYVFP